ncbi:MAG: hydrogenase small subunit [Coriobacteriia bacterium]|nr:hydrogenase small subunit [Coriobacteriia bacterium]
MTTKETCIESFDAVLEERGVSRRRFLQFCGALAVTLGLSEAMVPSIHEALAESVIGKADGNLMPVIWLELASCTGCTESLASAETPDVATIVLELLSLNYAETLSAGAGFSLEEAKEQTIEHGGYIVVVEGALMEGWNGNALKIANEKAVDIVRHCASNAAAIVCAGSCSVDGGWQAAVPNPGGATGIQAFLERSKADGSFTHDIPPIINIPSCPSNPEHIIAVLVDVLLIGRFPDLNQYGMPSAMFDQYVHDNCPRRGHFENGEFVYQFGSVEEAKGFCLYPMGCKGPQTKNNCPIVRWNRRVSWCVEAGAPCAGCATANPLKSGRNWVDTNAPFLKRFRSITIADIPFQPMVIGWGVTGVVAALIVIHGIGMKATGRTKGGADFEAERKWDKKHPDKALGPSVKALEASKKNAKPKAKAEKVEAEVASEETQEGGDE